MVDLKIREFLKDYPGMSLVPQRDGSFVLEGKFSFLAVAPNGLSITDTYRIEIRVPEEFPRAIPKVIELAQKIPRDGKHHVNYDGTLCMGSALRILQKINEKPTLVGFAEKCLVPYLFGASYKMLFGKDFPFGELSHGDQGILDDYMDLFGLKTKEQVKKALKLLELNEHEANKHICPCNCGMRLGQCDFRHKINRYRNLASRDWLREHLNNLGAGK